MSALDFDNFLSQILYALIEKYFHIVEKDVDGTTLGLIASPERKEKLDFAYVAWTEPYSMVVPRPGEVPKLFAFIRPFQQRVIIC